MGLNLLFIACCLPVVTIPPAITAMSKVFLNLAREGNTFFIKDFMDEFKESFWKSWVAFVPLLALIGIGIAGYAAIDDVYANLPVIVVFVALCGLMYCQANYCFCMIALVDLPIGKIMKNSFLMVISEMRRNAFMIMTIPVFVLCAIFSIYAIPFVLLFVFSLTGMINAMIANDAIEERVIQPYLMER